MIYTYISKESNRIGAVTAVHPPARFGLLDFKDNLVTSFQEKAQTDKGWINGGFLFLRHLLNI